MPKRVLTPHEITALDQLNQRLATTEKWILDLADRFEEETLALEPHDWKLELTYEFTTGSESEACWFTSLKHTLEERRNLFWRAKPLRLRINASTLILRNTRREELFLCFLGRQHQTPQPPQKFWEGPWQKKEPPLTGTQTGTQGYGTQTRGI